MIHSLLQKSKFYLLLAFSILLTACNSGPDTSKPTFSSPNKLSIVENTTSVLTIKASDSSSISFSINSGEDKARFLLTSNGVLSFKSKPDFEKPADSNKDNKYIITVKATDSSKNIALQTITVTVTDADEIKPIFTSATTFTMKEGSTHVAKIQATDDNTVSYAITAGEDANQFSIQEKTGELSFKATPDYANPTDKNKDNQYLVNITATDKANNIAALPLVVRIIENTINLTGDYTATHLGKAAKLDITVDLGATPKALYVLFTNHDASTAVTPSITHDAPKLKTLAASVSSPNNKILKDDNTLVKNTPHKPSYIREFNANSRKLLTLQAHKPKQKNISIRRKKVAQEGNTDTFYMGETDFDSATNKTEATARKVVSADTNFGTKTLSIWVSNDIFDADNSGSCKKDIGANHIECITQDLVDELAVKFLKDNGKNNDTYDWVTNIYGEEWGQQQYSGLITPNNEISILLTDLGNDNELGGTIGYFYAKDNYLKSQLSGSNERVMFYLDAIMFASTSKANYWRKAVYATLTHEFTHLIEFYQKDIKRLPSNKTSDTWLAEMVAESTEYLTSYIVGHDSPRGILSYDGTAGSAFNLSDRYPDYNKYNNTFSLSSFDNSFKDYSKVSSFGTFLVNNYGGPQVLHDILYSTYTDEKAVVEAVNKYQVAHATSNITFGEILRNWGVAVLLSDKVMNTQSATPRYNTGGFTNLNYNGFVDQNGTPSGNSTEYKIGSINFFNYSFCPKKSCTNVSEFQDGPTISTSIGAVKPHGNFFYKVADKLTGKVTLTIDAGKTIDTTIIAK